MPLSEEFEGVAYPVTESKESRLAASGNCICATLRKDDEIRLLGFELSSEMITLDMLRSSNTSKSSYVGSRSHPAPS